MTKGFKVNFLGISISATHLANPIFILTALILFRIAITFDTKKLLLLIASIFICLSMTEITLRVYPTLLGELFATKVLSKYHTRYDGIYVYDPVLKMNFMKPNFKTIAYWNGYRWKHETDSRGFRNPVDRDQADIILLGDSFIYGHGVNHDQTVGHFLEKTTDYSVMNLARQGDCSFQQAYILNKYGLKLRPKYVIYFFYENDISDLRAYLTREEMRRFVENPVMDIEFKDSPLLKKITDSGMTGINRFYKKKFYIAEAINLVQHLINKKLAKRKKSDKRTYQVTANSLEWKYTEKAILQMKYVSDTNGAVFVIAPIIYNKPRQFAMLEKIAKENNIPFVDTRSMNNVKSYRLPRDGHFSEEGALAMAKLVAEYLLKEDRDRE